MSESCLEDEIMEVWGDYDDFDSWDYIAFLMEENAQDLRESTTPIEVEQEFADQIICAGRGLAMIDSGIEEAVQRRLAERMDGNQEEIIQEYKRRYRCAA